MSRPIKKEVYSCPDCVHWKKRIARPIIPELGGLIFLKISTSLEMDNQITVFRISYTFLILLVILALEETLKC